MYNIRERSSSTEKNLKIVITNSEITDDDNLIEEGVKHRKLLFIIIIYYVFLEIILYSYKLS